MLYCPKCRGRMDGDRCSRCSYRKPDNPTEVVDNDSGTTVLDVPVINIAPESDSGDSDSSGGDCGGGDGRSGD